MYICRVWVYARVCACALVTLTCLNTHLDFARSPFYHGQLFAGPHGKRQVKKGGDPALSSSTHVDVGVKEGKTVAVFSCMQA